jgi:hypothetical protein
VRWVDRRDLADDQPVEQHADRSQVLLDVRPGRRALPYGSITGFGYFERLDVSGDMKRFDIGELAAAVLLEPGGERADGPAIG